MKRGGKVRTVKIKGTNKYYHVCVENGKTYKGHTKTKKGKS